MGNASKNVRPHHWNGLIGIPIKTKWQRMNSLIIHLLILYIVFLKKNILYIIWFANRIKLFMYLFYTMFGW